MRRYRQERARAGVDSGALGLSGSIHDWPSSVGPQPFEAQGNNAAPVRLKHNHH
jgi:hypothetical protein